jgi:hypothetical protein
MQAAIARSHPGRKPALTGEHLRQARAMIAAGKPKAAVARTLRIGNGFYSASSLPAELHLRLQRPPALPFATSIDSGASSGAGGEDENSEFVAAAVETPRTATAATTTSARRRRNTGPVDHSHHRRLG